MRLFIAMALPPAIKEWITMRQAKLQRALPQPGLRWTGEDQWHITLRFLGECPDAQVASVVRAMAHAAANAASFALRLGKPGIFSGPRMGVLWLSVALGKESLAALAQRLNESLLSEGFPTELRPFRPHLTMARSRHAIVSPGAVDRMSFDESPPFTVFDFHLYKSLLTPSGARYSLVATAHLGE